MTLPIFINKRRNILQRIPNTVYTAAIELYGTKNDLFNETFYKSFQTVEDADPYQIVLDKLLHYFSTYGAEALGVEIPTYVPVQALEIPSINYQDPNAKFIIIRVMPEDDCIAILDDYLKNLTAPSSKNLPHIEVLLTLTRLKTDNIKSFELQTLKHDIDGTVPYQPLHILRYLIYKTTEQTLIIKNDSLINRIKDSAISKEYTARDILTRCNLKALSSIFLRYKPIFLAYKKHKGCVPIINRLRKLAEFNHKPLDEVCLQNFTKCQDSARRSIIESAQTRDLIKLYNSLANRTLDAGQHVFAIRNGKTFVKEGSLSAVADYWLSEVYSCIKEKLSQSLTGKTFYIPEYVDYAAPTTEKQFTGNIPWGTRISCVPDGAFTAGIHWFNDDKERVDLDLHLNSVAKHFGWNGEYKNAGAKIIFTGDQTDAPPPNGAAEAFWFTPNTDTFVLTATLYYESVYTNTPVKYTLFMNTIKPEDANKRFRHSSYTYDAGADIFPPIPLCFSNDNQMTIGVFMNGGFYVYGGALDDNVIPRANYADFIKGITAQISSKLTLKNLLAECGAVVVSDSSMSSVPDVISLTPEDLKVNTLMNIIDGLPQ